MAVGNSCFLLSYDFYFRYAYVSSMSFGWCLAGGFLAWLCEIGITCLAALRSYTLLGLSVCLVKFSFLLTFLLR